VKNEENDFVINQIENLKKQYEVEREALPGTELDNPMKYMEEFQSFNKPPVLPEEVNN
jgi:hypothetical protein